jgi:hypothetical protein
MPKYDPDHAPDPKHWLALDEQLRISLAERFHRAARIELPSIKTHAAFHAIVENQIAMQHAPAVRAMERLAKQGLSRHECLHAIGWVLAQHLYELSTSTTEDTPAVNQARYDAALERLTAADWRAQAEE